MLKRPLLPALVTALSFLGANPAMAALVGNITLQGTVAASTSITVDAEPGYNSLNLHSDQSNLLVATVIESNNTAAGYTVTLSSANAGKLKNGSLDEISYTARYDGVAVTLSAAPVTITNQGAQTDVVNVAKEFDISYTGAPADELMAGTYSDTLVFTIASN